MYWDLVDRPNLMIKIPATDAGMPAIEEALFDGLNINVTLLFSVAAYERVMEAYIRAMERRLEAGKPLDRHSVASFFVSRVDTEVDKRLEALGQHRAAGHGRAWPTPAPPTRRSSASSRASASPKLREAGCPVQRPLWASTGVKNPAYPPTLYVWGLVAPDTVNTMPLPVLQAAGKPRARSPARPRAEDPSADLRRWPTPGSTSTTSPISCCARASTRSWSRCRSCWTGSRPSGPRSPRTISCRSKPSGSSRSCAARSCSSRRSSCVGPSATIRPR